MKYFDDDDDDDDAMCYGCRRRVWHCGEVASGSECDPKVALMFEITLTQHEFIDPCIYLIKH